MHLCELNISSSLSGGCKTQSAVFYHLTLPFAEAFNKYPSDVMAAEPAAVLFKIA